MDSKIVHNIREILYVTIIWITVTMTYVYIKFSDIPEEMLSQIYHAHPGMTHTWVYKLSFVISLTAGMLLGTLHTFIYTPLGRRRSMLFNIVFRCLILFVLSLLVFFIILFIYRDSSTGIGPDLSDAVRRKFIITTFVFVALTESLVGIFIVLRRSLGSSYLLNTIVNTYRSPKEEERVFMFLDMEDSTPAVEKMGHLQFSKYIQDCFFELSDFVLDYGGEIYQFVGDEAVITWKVSGNFNYGKCIDLFFAYKNHLDRNSERYFKRYGCCPAFKASLHCGKVSTALVGDYKKEIAFHGDVLNICARLQSACRENNANVLASELFYSHVRNRGRYIAEPVLLVALKGIGRDQKAMRMIDRESFRE